MPYVGPPSGAAMIQVGQDVPDAELWIAIHSGGADLEDASRALLERRSAREPLRAGPSMPL